MTTYKEATLIEGRLVVGHSVRFRVNEKDAKDARGTVCEVTHEGKQRPRTVVKLRDTTLAFVQLVNVSPGKTIKQPGT
jgi:hypothetical protein